MKPEEILSRDIRRMLDRGGHRWYSTEGTHRGGIRHTAGIPDLIVFGNGRFTFAELKAPGGRLTQEQKDFRDDCDAAGVPWALWRSVGDAVKWLAGLRAPCVLDPSPQEGDSRVEPVSTEHGTLWAVEVYEDGDWRRRSGLFASPKLAETANRYPEAR